VVKQGSMIAQVPSVDSQAATRIRSLVPSFGAPLVGLQRLAALFAERCEARWLRPDFHVQPSPESNDPGSFRCDFAPLQSSYSSSPRDQLTLTALPTQGLVPLRGMTSRRPLIARFATTSLCSVLRLSQSLDGLLRRPAPRACSIPQPRPGFQSVQGLLPPRSLTPFPEQLPPCRCDSQSTARLRAVKWLPPTSRFSSARRRVSRVR
jgi:hypothetical protein